MATCRRVEVAVVTWAVVEAAADSGVAVDEEAVTEVVVVAAAVEEGTEEAGVVDSGVKLQTSFFFNSPLDSSILKVEATLELDIVIPYTLIQAVYTEHHAGLIPILSIHHRRPMAATAFQSPLAQTHQFHIIVQRNEYSYADPLATSQESSISTVSSSVGKTTGTAISFRRSTGNV